MGRVTTEELLQTAYAAAALAIDGGDLGVLLGHLSRSELIRLTGIMAGIIAGQASLAREQAGETKGTGDWLRKVAVDIAREGIG